MVSRTGVKSLGPIPSGLQGFLDPLQGIDSATQSALFGNAISIALVGYMESMTIASTGTRARSGGEQASSHITARRIRQ